MWENPPWSIELPEKTGASFPTLPALPETLSTRQIENEYGRFTLIDTAGHRRKSRVDDEIEKYSVLRAQMAIDRADVCVIMIDATEGFTEQDSKVAGLAHEAGKGCVIAVNKWDAVEKDGRTMQEYRKKLEVDFSFMSYAPIVFISAKTGQRLDRLFELIQEGGQLQCHADYYRYAQRCAGAGNRQGAAAHG